MTKKGYILDRQENSFIVKEMKLCYDFDTNLSYVEEHYHSQLTVFVGIGKDDCLQMLHTWLAFFGDEDLIAQVDQEVEQLFRQQKMLPVQISSNDDKDVN